jgi:hypothetical protein
VYARIRRTTARVKSGDCRNAAKLRNSRTGLYARGEMVETAFLFVGFSLSDPNFNLLHDDIRLVYGMNVPASYTVQGRRNPVKERYLRSLDVNTVWLDSWNALPDFLSHINPAGLGSEKADQQSRSADSSGDA